MTKADLKPGYVVKLRNGSVALLSIINEAFGGGIDKMILIYADGKNEYGWEWSDCDSYTDDLRNEVIPYEKDITEVYGYCIFAHRVLDFGNPGASRPLIWKRPEVKKMTVKEICEALGYDVEIVKEAPNA